MSRVVVIGATGHIGTYLVPRLVRGGHEVIAMSRGTRDPYHASPQWESVTRVTVDRDAEDEAGTFGARVAELRPDVVIDLICSPPPLRASSRRLRPSRPLLIHCGTIWVHGPRCGCRSPRTSRGRPTASTAPARRPSRPCCTRDAGRGRARGRAAPGHISGPGWPVITPGRQPGPGRLDPAGHRTAARAARQRPGRAEPRARGRRGAGLRAGDVPPGRDRGQLPRGRRAGDDAARAGGGGGGVVRPGAGARVHRLGGVRAPGGRRTRRRDTGAHGPQHHASIDRAREVLGYAPRYSTLDALHEALAWLVANGQADVGGQGSRRQNARTAAAWLTATECVTQGPVEQVQQEAGRVGDVAGGFGVVQAQRGLPTCWARWSSGSRRTARRCRGARARRAPGPRGGASR
jgi:Nucleoside-diphosphate-sugar epimerases